MKKMTKKLALLLCATIMAAGCLVGCGTKETSTTSTSKETKEVKSNDVENTSGDYGTLLMESEILKVYAKDNTMTFDCNNEEGIEDYRIKIYTNDENCLDIFSHDSWIGDEPSKNGIYSCSIDEDGAYSTCLSPDVDEENEMYNGFYAFDFEITNGIIDKDSFYMEEYAENPLPELSLYVTNLAIEDSIEDEEVYSDSDDLLDEINKTNFIVDGKTIPYPVTYKELNELFDGYDVTICEGEDIITFDENEKTSEIDESKEYNPFFIDYYKNGNPFLEIYADGGELNDLSFRNITIFNVEDTTFSLNLYEDMVISNTSTKDEILEIANNFEYMEDGDKIYILNSFYDGMNLIITFENEKIKELSIQ